MAERIFCGYFNLSRRIFLRIFSPDFFSSFLWGKSAQKIPPRNPRQNPPKFIQQKSPTHFCRLAGPNVVTKNRGAICDGGLWCSWASQCMIIECFRGWYRGGGHFTQFSGFWFNPFFRSHSGTFALKIEDFSKESVVLVKCKMDLVKPSPGQKALESIEKSVLINTFSRFPKTIVFLLKFSVLRAGVLK